MVDVPVVVSLHVSRRQAGMALIEFSSVGGHQLLKIFQDLTRCCWGDLRARVAEAAGV